MPTTEAVMRAVTVTCMVAQAVSQLHNNGISNNLTPYYKNGNSFNNLVPDYSSYPWLSSPPPLILPARLVNDSLLSYPSRPSYPTQPPNSPKPIYRSQLTYPSQPAYHLLLNSDPPYHTQPTYPPFSTQPTYPPKASYHAQLSYPLLPSYPGSAYYWQDNYSQQSYPWQTMYSLQTYYTSYPSLASSPPTSTTLPTGPPVRPTDVPRNAIPTSIAVWPTGRARTTRPPSIQQWPTEKATIPTFSHTTKPSWPTEKTIKQSFIPMWPTKKSTTITTPSWPTGSVPTTRPPVHVIWPTRPRHTASPLIPIWSKDAQTTLRPVTSVWPTAKRQTAIPASLVWPTVRRQPTIPSSFVWPTVKQQMPQFDPEWPISKPAVSDSRVLPRKRARPRDGHSKLRKDSSKPRGGRSRSRKGSPGPPTTLTMASNITLSTTTNRCRMCKGKKASDNDCCIQGRTLAGRSVAPLPQVLLPLLASERLVLPGGIHPPATHLQPPSSTLPPHQNNNQHPRK
nr:adhesive plaque matrix protein-like [Procambarus clarkii]